MQIRSERLIWSDYEIEDKNGTGLEFSPDWYALDESLHSPENARQLAEIRAHIIGQSEGVLIDVYQQITALEQKHQPGSPEAKKRFLKGLSSEVGELYRELNIAMLEHQGRMLADQLDDVEDAWLLTAIDTNRLRSTHLTEERRQAYQSELGDVLWYTSRLAAEADVKLSDAFLSFLQSINAGDLQQRIDRSGYDYMAERFAKTVDFEILEEVCLSQKNAFRDKINQGLPIERTVTIDNMPATMLGRIHDEELMRYQQLLGPDGQAKDPFQHPEELKLTVGKLLWFASYTSNTILDTNFRNIMAGNLQKMVNRSARGTLFERKNRTEQDEPEKTDHSRRTS